MKEMIKLAIFATFAVVAACANNKSNPQSTTNTVTATVELDGHSCPLRVQPSSCAGGPPSDAVCVKRDGDVIEWQPQNASFIIKPRQGAKVCDPNGSSHKKCKVKKPRDADFGNADGLAFKYAIESPGCDPIDPYIIVLR